MARQAVKISASVRQKQVLDGLISSRSVSAGLCMRAQIVMKSIEGVTNKEQAARLGCCQATIARWRKRWAQHYKDLCGFEAAGHTDTQLKHRICRVLSDIKRSGSVPKFSQEQLLSLVSLSCTKPMDFGIAESHWSANLLHKVSIEHEIFEEISKRSISRLLKQFCLAPHKVEGWLNSPDKSINSEEYKARLKKVSSLYQQAQELKERGVHLVSFDEKSGIQALEHKYPELPMRVGSVCKQEVEYVRNGTLCFFGCLEVATGKILSPQTRQRRTEATTTKVIKQLIETAPQDEWVIVLDQLNTHKSASLVEFVAEACSIDVDLGRKGSSGILKSMASRMAFLEDESHRIRFVYTPRHASWLNQIEAFFSILQRKLLKRSSFSSKQEAKRAILDFIAHYNDFYASPFSWKYAP